MDKMREEFEAWCKSVGLPWPCENRWEGWQGHAAWQAARQPQERGEAVAWGSEEHAELLALDLAKDEFDDPHEMVWEGYPLEPWGECWQKLIPDARCMIERVTAIAHPPAADARVAELEARIAKMYERDGEQMNRMHELDKQLTASREREGRMREEQAHDDATRERMSMLLTGVANALKGDPQDSIHSWADLPKVAGLLMAKNLRLVAAVQANHQWHLDYDEHDGYLESALYEANIAALAAEKEQTK